MKYCSKCGKELVDEAVVCVNCGCPAEYNNSANEKKRKSKIQTALVLNVIALIISLASIAMVVFFMTDAVTIGKRNADEKTFFEICQIKAEYEKAEFKEEKFLRDNRNDPEVKEYIKLEIDDVLEETVENSVPEVKVQRLISGFSQGRENSKMITCINLTLERARAEKRFEQYEEDYEATIGGLVLFGFLFLLVLVSFVFSIITKSKLNKSGRKKAWAWIYLAFVMIEDVVYVLCSFILFMYIICGVGIIIPVAPILQTIAAVKFLQATKE